MVYKPLWTNGGLGLFSSKNMMLKSVFMKKIHGNLGAKSICNSSSHL